MGTFSLLLVTCGLVACAIGSFFLGAWWMLDQVMTRQLEAQLLADWEAIL